ncbi:MAG TPA: hypothetical protein VIT41_10745 [Microlunatus sp.]
MSNDYAISLWIEQHHAELRHEAAQERLARHARRGHERRPRWWERLTLSRPHRAARRDVAPNETHAGRPFGGRRPTATATAAAGDSPC